LNSVILKRKRNRAISLLKRMVSIPSSNPHISDEDEKGIAKFLKEELQDAGLEVKLHQVTSEPYWAFVKGRRRTRANVIARTGNKNGTKLILNGHMDTVSGDTMERAFQPRVVGDRLYGRGSADMKGGVAAMIAAAEAVQESSPSLKGELVLSLVVDEETRGQGTKEFLEQEHGDFAIVAEPTGNTLAIAQAGYVDFNISSLGQSRHGQSALPELWTSAFVQATHLCNRILEDKTLMRKKSYGGLDMRATFNFSPTHYAPPPSYAWMTLEEFRVNCLLGVIPGATISGSQASIDRSMKRIKELVAMSNRQGQRNRLEVVDTGLGFIQAANAHTRTFERAMRRVLGHSRHSYMYSFCDAAYFYRANIPTIVFGPGTLREAHGTKEYVSMRQVVGATSVLAHAVERILANTS